MKNIFKKLFVSIMVVMFLLILINFVFAGQESSKYLSIGGCGTGGMSYAYGAAVASIASKNTDLNFTCEATGCSVENMRLLLDGKTEITAMMNDVWRDAYLGLGDYDENRNLRGLHVMYPQIWYLITPADSDIMSYEDIKGKRVSVGSPGSGTEFKARRVLKSMGITYDDFRVEYLSNVEMISGLRDGILDAAFFTLPYESAAILELDATMDIRIIGLEEDDIVKITTEYSEYIKAVIPKGSLKAAKSDIPTLALWASMITTSDLPEDVAYKYVKAIMENLDSLSAIHPGGKYTTPESTIESFISPLHPGAIKYYEEIGLTVPTSAVPK